MRSITPKKGTPTAQLYNKKGSGQKSKIDGVTVWLKGESPTWADDRQSPCNERAAYLVNRMLRLNMVPTTVLRLHEGKLVSAQKWVTGKVPTNTCPAMLRVFDYIIANCDRHEGNWRVDGKKVWAIDNAYTFTERENGTYELSHLQDLSNARIARLKKWLERALADKETLHKKFDSLLGESKTDALIKRMEHALAVAACKEVPC